MSESDLNALSKEELMQKIQTLEAHNKQLKNIIEKRVKEKKLKNDSKSFDFSRYNFRHVLLKFFYLGWDYNGLAVQEDTNNTIEHIMFEALKKTCLIEDRSKSNYHRCGRTDKGVSSFGQVISIDLRTNSTENEINYCKVLNRVLPDNIQCIAWAPVDTGFSARFNCKSRSYKYFFPKGNLNIQKMKQAAQKLVGTHDFRNFCKMDVNNGVTNFTRKIIDIEINCDENNDEYRMCVMSIKGQAFLWHQIRCLMAILFLIGEEKEQVDVIDQLLNIEENLRKPEYNMASEVPLNLFECEYENVDWVYDNESLNIVLNKLRNLWTFSSVKSSMIKIMLENVEGIVEGHRHLEDFSKSSITDSLVPGVKSKKYTPLLNRPKCKSLETRIEDLKRRKRLEQDGSL